MSHAAHGDGRICRTCPSEIEHRRQMQARNTVRFINGLVLGGSVILGTVMSFVVQPSLKVQLASLLGGFVVAVVLFLLLEKGKQRRGSTHQ